MSRPIGHWLHGNEDAPNTTMDDWTRLRVAREADSTMDAVSVHNVVSGSWAVNFMAAHEQMQRERHIANQTLEWRRAAIYLIRIRLETNAESKRGHLHVFPSSYTMMLVSTLPRSRPTRCKQRSSRHAWCPPYYNLAYLQFRGKVPRMAHI